MEYTLEEYMKLGQEFMDKSIEHFKHELAKIRTGKASTQLFTDLLVEYYGVPTPLSQVANLTVADSKTIIIQPWEKSMLAPIEHAIFSANLGLTPQNDGEIIRITIPALTEERRKDLVKQAKHEGEEAKISIRNSRHKLLDFIKKEVKSGYPEDLGKRKEKEVEELIKEYYDKVNHLLEAKEKEIMTV